MGSIVFPDAELKVFLTASPEARAERRYKQLKEKGIAATLAALLQDLREARRARCDAQRGASQAKPRSGGLRHDVDERRAGGGPNCGLVRGGTGDTKPSTALTWLFVVDQRTPS